LEKQYGNQFEPVYLK